MLVQKSPNYSSINLHIYGFVAVGHGKLIFVLYNDTSQGHSSADEKKAKDSFKAMT